MCVCVCVCVCVQLRVCYYLTCTQLVEHLPRTPYCIVGIFHDGKFSRIGTYSPIYYSHNIGEHLAPWGLI